MFKESAGGDCEPLLFAELRLYDEQLEEFAVDADISEPLLHIIMLSKKLGEDRVKSLPLEVLKYFYVRLISENREESLL